MSQLRVDAEEFSELKNSLKKAAYRCRDEAGILVAPQLDPFGERVEKAALVLLSLLVGGGVTKPGLR